MCFYIMLHNFFLSIESQISEIYVLCTNYLFFRMIRPYPVYPIYFTHCVFLYMYHCITTRNSSTKLHNKVILYMYLSYIHVLCKPCLNLALYWNRGFLKHLILLTIILLISVILTIIFLTHHNLVTLFNYLDKCWNEADFNTVFQINFFSVERDKYKFMKTLNDSLHMFLV